jgi:hypothetical protein
MGCPYPIIRGYSTVTVVSCAVEPCRHHEHTKGSWPEHTAALVIRDNHAHQPALQNVATALHRPLASKTEWRETSSAYESFEYFLFAQTSNFQDDGHGKATRGKATHEAFPNIWLTRLT